MKKIKGYIYSQNNSGGSFDKVINSYEEEKVFPLRSSYGEHWGYISLGVIDRNYVPDIVYFDGVKKGIDCSCCGDRWYGCSEDEFYIFETKEEYEENKDKLKNIEYLIMEDINENND